MSSNFSMFMQSQKLLIYASVTFLLQKYTIYPLIFNDNGIHFSHCGMSYFPLNIVQGAPSIVQHVAVLK